MATTTSPTTGTTINTSLNALAPVWRELDCIYLEDGDLLTRAAESVASVKASMLSGNQFDCLLLAEQLNAALKDIAASRMHLESVVEELGNAN